MIKLLPFLLVLLIGRAQAGTNTGILFPTPDESILNLLVRDDIARADHSWFSLGLGAAVFEARQNVLLPRWSGEFRGGYRFGRTGVFLRLALDQSFDFTQEIKRLDIYDVGIGMEKLFLYGRIRTSASAGVAILGTDTDFDEKWERGWYCDLRPISVRAQVFGSHVLEITPLSAHLSIPVAKGIPLILFSYFTHVSLEFEGPW